MCLPGLGVWRPLACAWAILCSFWASSAPSDMHGHFNASSGAELLVFFAF